HRVQRVALLPAGPGIRVARIAEQVLAADGGGEVAPHVLVHRLHVDERVVVGPAGRAGIGAAGHAARDLVVLPHAGLAVAVVLDVAAPHEVGHHLLHRDLHELSLPGALALDVGGHDGAGRVHAGAGVADGGAAADWLAIGEAGHAHHAAGGLGNHVEALVLVVRAGEPEALDARHDDARVRRAQPLPVEAQALHEPGREVLDDDVGALDHLEKELLAFGLLQIDGDAALVGVEHEEEHRVEARNFGAIAPRLLAARRLDLDHVGPEPAQELGAGGAGLELREVEDPHAGQRALGHRLRAPLVRVRTAVY